jgi:hypothetical protein
MNQLKIIGIQVTDRIKEAGRAQRTLTQYAENVRTRLGFHELNDAVCSRTGLILLELTGDIKEMDKLEAALHELHEVQVNKMVFSQ